MTVSKSQMLATRKYNEKAYDRVELKLKSGEKEKVKELAKGQGESLNGFINKAIEERVERIKKEQA